MNRTIEPSNSTSPTSQKGTDYQSANEYVAPMDSKTDSRVVRTQFVPTTRKEGAVTIYLPAREVKEPIHSDATD